MHLIWPMTPTIPNMSCHTSDSYYTHRVCVQSTREAVAVTGRTYGLFAYDGSLNLQPHLEFFVRVCVYVRVCVSVLNVLVSELSCSSLKVVLIWFFSCSYKNNLSLNYLWSAGFFAPCAASPSFPPWIYFVNSLAVSASPSLFYQSMEISLTFVFQWRLLLNLSPSLWESEQLSSASTLHWWPLRWCGDIRTHFLFIFCTCMYFCTVEQHDLYIHVHDRCRPSDRWSQLSD